MKKAKKLLVLALSLALLLTIFPATAMATENSTTASDTEAVREILASGECGAEGDNAIWTLYNDGEMVIDGSGDMAQYAKAGDVPWCTDYQSVISKVTIKSGITSISPRAFLRCTNLTDVVIPDSVTVIGSSAFNNCTALTSIAIPNSVTQIGIDAFFYCTSLEAVYITDIAKWCSIQFEADTSNPLCRGVALYLNGEPVESLTIPGSVNRIGDYAFLGCTSLTSVTIPDSVTGIGNGAFYKCYWLTNISIPDTVKEIGSEAFAFCINLPEITLPSSLTTIAYGTFRSCSALTSMDIPEGVTCIGDLAFRDCSALQSITMPPFMSALGSEAFCGCSALAEITLPEGISEIGNSTFRSCTALTAITIPDSVKSIIFDAFKSCAQLKEIKFSGDAPEFSSSVFCDVTATAYYPLGNPTWTEDVMQNYGGTLTWVSYRTVIASGYYGINSTNVTWTLYSDGELVIAGTGKMATYLDYEMVPWYAEYRSLIKKVTIEEGVTSICHWAFYECTNLTSITIPNTVTHIGCRAFDSCTGLTSIAIPSSVTVMDEYAFKNCTGLTGVYIEDLASWCAIYFDSDISNPVTFAGNLYLNGELVVNLVIPDGINLTKDGTFYGCTSLESVVLPDSVTELGYYAFAECPNLTSVSLPNSLTIIGHNAFRKCTGLTNITLPDSLTYIDSSAFYGCTGLKDITIPGSVTNIIGYAFYGCTGLTEIKFLGDAPSFTDSVFETVTATAYYPAGNATWTEDVMQDYGGTITWVSYEDVEKPTFSAKGVTLSFQDEIFMNVYFVPSNADSVVSYGLITFNEKVTPDMSLAVTKTVGTVTSNNTLGVTSPGIAAKNMGDKMYFAIYAELTDGSYAYSNCYTYSPIDYAYSLLSKDSTPENMKSLIVAMLNYGAAAQTYFGYNTGNLVNASLTEEQKTMVVGYNNDMLDGLTVCAADKKGTLFGSGNTGFTKRTPSVNFEGAFSVNFYFSQPKAAVGSDVTFYVWDKATYESAAVLLPENAIAVSKCTFDGTYYAGIVEDIAAKEVDETFYCAAVFTGEDGSTYVSGVIAYSLGYYLENQANGTKMPDFAKATGVYAYYAKTLFNN